MKSMPTSGSIVGARFSARSDAAPGATHLGTRGTIIGAAAASVCLGALTAKALPIAVALVLGVGLVALVYVGPVFAFCAVVVAMAMPFPWTPSVGGHFLNPAEIGGAAFLGVALLRGQRVRFTAVDYIVVAYVFTAFLAAVANGESLTLLRNALEGVLLPYLGWRFLLESNPQARRAFGPLLIAIGVAAAGAGLVEALVGSNPFNHILVNPRLAIWAQTITRDGLVRVSSSFGYPIGFGMFLLIPFGLALANTKVPGRAVYLALLVSAEVLTLSRGPWVGAIALVGFLLPPVVVRSSAWSLIGAVAAFIATAIVLAHPIASVISSTGHLGTAANGNATYRVDLLSASVSHGQLFGNPFDPSIAGSLYSRAGFTDVASWYALTLGQTGWVGLMTLLALASAAAGALWRGYRTDGRGVIALAAIVLAQMVALVAAPPITNYADFLWLSVAALAACVATSVTKSTAGASRSFERFSVQSELMVPMVERE